MKRILIFVFCSLLYHTCFSQEILNTAVKNISIDLADKLIHLNRKKIIVLFVTDINQTDTTFGKYLTNGVTLHFTNDTAFTVFERESIFSIAEVKRMADKGYVVLERSQKQEAILEGNTIIIGNYTVLSSTVELTLKALDAYRGITITASWVKFPIDNDVRELINPSSVNKSNEHNYIAENNLTPFDTIKGGYNVLIFPFQSLQSCHEGETRIELAIKYRLQEISDKDSLKLQIKFCEFDTIYSAVEAEEKGKMANANMVIWGDLYERCGNENEACLKFNNISLENTIPGVNFVGESGIIKFKSLSEVSQGKLLQDIDYILYWVAASHSFSQMDYIKATYYLEKIEKNYVITASLYAFFGDCYCNLNLPKDAAKYYKKALKIDVNDAEIHNDYGVILVNELHNWKSARKHFKTAVKINPNNYLAQYNYGTIIQDKSIYAKRAREHLEKAFEINPEEDMAHNNLGNLLLYKFKDAAGAKEQYKKAIEINPNNDIAHFNLGILLMEQYNDTIGAKEQFEKALELDPNFDWYQYYYAFFLKDIIGGETDAIEHYHIAIKLNPKLRTKSRDAYFGVK